MLSVRPIMCMKKGPDPVPPKRKVRVADIDRAVKRAYMICYKNENTPACSLAWDKADEVSKEFARQLEKNLVEEYNEHSDSGGNTGEMDDQ
jgi:hypothetical protein